MTVKSYQGLSVWHKAVDLAAIVHELTKKIPQTEIYSLTNHIKRASIEIPSRIAIGNERKNNAHYVRFLYAARGSVAELETLLHICVKIGFLNDDEISAIMELLDEIGKMTTNLIKSVEARGENLASST